MFWILAVLALTGPCLGSAPPVIVSVTYDSTSGQFSVVDGTVEDRVAWGNFTDQIDENGWSFLKIVTNGSYPDTAQAYAAGLAEGYLTTDLIYLTWMNTIDGYCSDPKDADYCTRLWNFLNDNKQWMKQQTTQYGGNDTYWHQVNLLNTQLQGLQTGYQQQYPFNENDNDVLKDFGFLFFQLGGDLEDLEMALNKSYNLRHVQGSGACSALIKFIPDNADLYVAHDSWNTYQSMLRTLKKYEFHYHLTDSPDSPLIPGLNLSMSSYPGSLHSMDDFYTISSGLMTLETTIGNNNPDLWKYVQPQTIFEYARVMIANRIGTTGSSWSAYFSKYNSGTYNNEWMVVDYNKYTPGQKDLKNDLLWVIEQLPGYIVADDQTDVLRQQGYWASYNAPYYPLIYNLSGTAELVQEYGDWYSYYNTPRALIFKRDQGNVVDLTTMTSLMRYNDFKNDPLSACNCTPPYSAENSIAARSDLNPANGTYEIEAEGHRAHGAIDMKLTSYAYFWKLQFIAYAGPTYDQQPPFSWSTFDLSDTTPHLGMPDLWQFTPVLTEFE